MTDTSHYVACLKSMKWLKCTTKWRFIITAFSLVINSMMYFVHMFTKATLEWSPQNTYLSFVFLIASVVLGAYILYLSAAASASPEKSKILCILLGVLLLARLTNIVLNVFTFLIPLWATQFFQVKKAKWLTEQEGYPYFSERFEKQKVSNEYIPPYKPDDGPSEPPEMPGIPDIPDEEET